MTEFLPTSLTPSAFTSQIVVPALIEQAGPHARDSHIEFFAAHIRNLNTRFAYSTAIRQFLSWCEAHQLALHSLTPTIVSVYVESLLRTHAAPSVKQKLAALKRWMDHLVISRVLATNPCHAVRGPRYSITKGKTPVLSAGEARRLLDSIEPTSLINLRDRALIAVMVYSFARVSAVVGMNVEDYAAFGKRWRLRLYEKNGKDHEVPVHHKAEEYLDAYLESAGIATDSKSPLFRTIDGKRGTITTQRMNRRDALQRVKRRAEAAGLPTQITNHTFRATGITVYLQNGGLLENAQAIAAHNSTSTTKLYDRRAEAISLDEIERIVI
jgi:integrase/recombinase XerD